MNQSEKQHGRTTHGVRERLSQMKSKQFIIWIVTFTSVYAITATILIALSVPTQYSLLIGLILAEPLDKAYEWLGEWYNVEKEASEYNVE